MANATRWCRYRDASRPELGQQLLSLASPDLADPRKATRRAMETAKKRLPKRGVKPVGLSCQCVG